MKVKIETTVEVDEQAWAEEFGLDPTDKAAIREDVKTYCAGTVRDQIEQIGMEAK